MDYSSYYPAIIEYSPSELSADVTTKPEIAVRFSMDMDSVKITEQLIDNLVVLTDRATGTRVPVSLEPNKGYNVSTRTLYLLPDTDLSVGEDYVITLLAGFPALTGRSTAIDTIWSFQVAVGTVPEVTLSDPADAVVRTSESVTFSWNTVGVDYSYTLQVSATPNFSALVYNADLGSTAATPSGLAFGNTYYWRVRAFSTADPTSVGPWSAVRSLALKSSTTQAASDSAVKTVFGTLGVVSYYPPDGSSGLDAWRVNITFNEDVDPNSLTADYIWVSSYHVDGDTLGARKTVPVNYTLTGTRTVTLTLVDETDWESNRRYTVTVLGVNGKSLQVPFTFRFTSTYAPLYIPAEVLQETYGRFLRRYTTDEINYQLHRSSIRANRIALQAEGVAIDTLMEPLATVSYDITRYVEVHAAYCLIQNYQFELLEQADRKLQVDSLNTDVGSSILEDISGILRNLDDERNRLEVVLGGSVSPVSGVKSSKWSPSQKYDDLSTSHLGRAKF